MNKDTEFLSYVEEFANDTWAHQEFISWLEQTEDGRELILSLGDKVNNYKVSFRATF